jgi:hypothetical protein
VPSLVVKAGQELSSVDHRGVFVLNMELASRESTAMRHTV